MLALKTFNRVILRRALFTGLVLLASLSIAHADPNPFGWFTQFFHFPSQKTDQPSVKRAPPPKPGAKPRLATRARQGPLSAGKEMEKPKISPSVFIAVFGDGLAQLLSMGLMGELEDHPELAVLHKTQDNSGLVRTDVVDWNQTIRDYFAGSAKIDIGVILIGSNDRQPIISNGESFDALSPEWSELYAQRIEAIAQQFAERKIPLLWVGLPVMKSDAASKDATALNELIKEHAERFGAAYIDIWEGFADEHGLYSAFGPDINGEIVRLRRSDGVYFTRAGARKLAHFAELEIRRKLDKLAPASKPEATTPQPNLESNLVAEPVPAIAIKPPIGPVLPLTARFLAPGGTLYKTPADVTSRGPAKNGEAKVLIEQVLQEGKPLEPKKGRADDFSQP